jgi:GMP synthase-like glutamine amidotransferase
MKYISVVQHTQSEWLGLMEDHLEGRRIRFGYSRPFTAGGSLPDDRVLGDGLILLGGGPWGSVSAPLLPTLDADISLARKCLMLETPVIGIGLGAQIICIAGDGNPEAADFAFDVSEATSVRDDALNGFLPKHFPMVTYGRDRIGPPRYAEILAVDAGSRPALFQIGRNAFGFSGHPGVKLAMIEDLMMEFDETPDDFGPKLDRLRAKKTEIEDALVSIMTGLIQATAWMAD